MMNIESLKIYESFTVILQLRHITGMKYGFLQPDLNPNDFEEWWRNVETAHKFFIFDKENLPGPVHFISNDKEFKEFLQIAAKEAHWRLIIEFDKNSFLWKPGGINIFHKGKTESDNSRTKPPGS